MQIRAITGFIDPGWPLDPKKLKDLGTSLQACRTALEDSGHIVQSLRMATPPPAEMENAVQVKDRVALARQLEAECFVHDLDYAAIGPALPEDMLSYEIIPDMLAATRNVFTTGLFADLPSGLSLPAARACAEAIHTIANIETNGFGNLRFAALVNVPAGVPFFPAAYHRGGPPALALAIEAADLPVNALDQAESLADVRQRLIDAIETQANALTHITERISREHSTRFLGIDFSFAPFPEVGRSLGTALERLGVPSVGSGGSAAAAAFLADCLDRAVFQRVGFCGLFLPVFEDSILAQRAAEGVLSLSDLLLYATLCGTGLDTIPLPGDSSVEALTGLLIDLGAVGLRHAKPLTARLMPIPGKNVGDEISFDFPYFAPSRIMPLPDRGPGGFLAGLESMDIHPHREYQPKEPLQHKC
jgi:uncharacterized protein (UPF0210 family)